MFYTIQELKDFGFNLNGEKILVGKNCSFFNPQNITLENNTRIDDGALLSAHGTIHIKEYVHISRNTLIYSGSKVVIGKFAIVSSDCKLYGMSDTFDGSALIGPMVPQHTRKVVKGDIILEDYASVATSCVILPSVTIKEGTVIGAMSFVKKTPGKSWTIYAGNPLKEIKERKKDMKCLM